jgi:magnesium transporter
MTPEYVALSEKFTVTQALNYIRCHGQDSDTVNVVYVVKATDELVGSLRIRSLIMSDPEKPVLELILVDVPQLFAGDLVGKAAETFNPVDLYALPVVDSSGKMLGVVTADDILQAAQQEATREVQKIGGSAPLEVPYLKPQLSTCCGSADPG